MRTIDPDSVYEYIPQCDRKLAPHEQSRFFLRPLTLREQKAILNRQDPSFDQRTKKVTMSSKHGDVTFDVARAVIKRWENVLHADGTEIPCALEKTGLSFGVTVEAVSEDSIKFIPWVVIAEIYKFAIDGCELDEDDAGNS